MINCMRMTRVLALLLIPFASACDKGAEWVLESHESERYSFTQFMDRVGKFPYAAEQSKLNRVQEGFKRLKPGMRKDEIRHILGEPDSEFLNYKRKEKHRELIYSTWGYHLKRFDRRMSNEGFDQAIILYFKSNEELYWADPNNIAALKPVGGPDLYPEAMITIKRQ